MSEKIHALEILSLISSIFLHAPRTSLAQLDNAKEIVAVSSPQEIIFAELQKGLLGYKFPCLQDHLPSNSFCVAGTCASANSSAKRFCLCQPGFIGSRCDLYVGRCHRENPCVPHGCKDDPRRHSGLQCLCNPGFRNRDDDHHPDPGCMDVDECREGSHGCKEGEVCFNMPGGYGCLQHEKVSKSHLEKLIDVLRRRKDVRFESTIGRKDPHASQWHTTRDLESHRLAKQLVMKLRQRRKNGL